VGGADRRMPRPLGEVWRFEPEGRGAVLSTPLVAGDRLYIATVVGPALGQYGTLFCLDANTGKELWHFDNGGQMKKAFSSPCLADGKIYFGEGFHEDSDCKLFCLDASTGNKLWEF